MKTLMLFLTVIFLAKGCGSEATEKMQWTKITYEAMSRGYFRSIELTGNYMSVRDKRDGASRDFTLSEADFKELATLYSKIDISKLPEYKGPTQKRFYDGAAIGTLSVTEKENTFTTEGFDHGDPPLEIAEFVNKLIAIAKL